MILLVFSLIILISFSFVIFFGAPYVPTLNQQRQAALDLLDLKPGQLFLELGSGDGRLLVAAAKRGLKSVGYELNPILYLISRLVTYKYRRQIKVEYGNFWSKQWPPADGIYSFIMQKYMAKLDKKIVQSNRKNIKLVSYAFYIPGKKILRRKQGLLLYEY
jgi:cyclopropane fatty-acyl-phospholipid synthase-like methyltransferase